MEAAGTLGGIMIIGGILGSIVIPGISDKYQNRKLPLIISLMASIVIWYILSILYTFVSLAISLFTLGFFFMSLLPLALELSAESVDKRYVGTANSILWEFSQIGAFILILLYEAVAKLFGWNSVFHLSSLLVLISLILALTLRKGLEMS
jgi:MFS family permease